VSSGNPQRRFAWRIIGFLALLLVSDGFLTLFGVVLPTQHYLEFAFAMGACVLVLARHGGVRPVWVPAILTIALAATLAWWPWHGRKAFFRDVTELEPGAPRADVRARMDRWHRKHPFEDHAPSLANLDPRRDLWSRGAGSFDQVVVSYDESDRVVKIERLVD
jgi:hypothetical protein